MPREPSTRSRAVVAARWPFGIALTSWHYLWRTTPIGRTNKEGSAPDDLPPPLANTVDGDDAQNFDVGVGPLFRRRYRVAMRDARCDATQLMEKLSADPNCVSPTTFAKFQKVEGADGKMRVGDEFVVRMPGPWDGPVRVCATTPTSFRFLTLAGHLEAGQIEWSCRDGEHLTFQIESWARAGDRLSAVMHDRLHMAKEVQLHMWTSVLERVVDVAGARRASMIEMVTGRIPPDQLPR